MYLAADTMPKGLAEEAATVVMVDDAAAVGSDADAYAGARTVFSTAEDFAAAAAAAAGTSQAAVDAEAAVAGAVVLQGPGRLHMSSGG